VLAHHPRYHGVYGVFADGTLEHRTTRAAYRLAAACRVDGIDAEVVVQPGGHNWQFGAREWAEQLPRIAASMTTTPT
jgi:S-formylglutathione hydrolase FrmB